MLIAALVAIAVVLLLASVLSVSDNLIQIEAKKRGIDTRKRNLSLIPNFGDIFGKRPPAHVGSSHFHNLTKGHDIKLVGATEGHAIPANATRYAIKPGNYRGNAPIPKLVVAVGDTVKAGEEVFFDKSNPDIKYVAPVSGEVIEIRRGAKRAITHVVILADKDQQAVQNDIINVDMVSREGIIDYLQKTGGWTLINQRPFDIVANPSVVPDNVFISTFSTAPLAPDYGDFLVGRAADLQEAVDTLAKLTNGKVYLGVDARGNTTNAIVEKIDGAEKHYFNGKHPAGNVGVQIHHSAPIRNGGVVWTLSLEEALTLGRLMNTGIYDTTKMVAVAGGQFNEPKLYKTYAGASIADLTKGNIVDGESTRLIIGDILSGKTAVEDDFMDAGVSLLTSIKEGDKHELFGWLLPIAPRPSISRTMPGFLLPNHKYAPDTNTHGERRAFVVTGQYEKMLPMDILPQHLMKAIMVGDIERMEGLGINELSEEDVALAEFACTSKQPLQKILREGLDMMREQG